MKEFQFRAIANRLTLALSLVTRMSVSIITLMLVASSVKSEEFGLFSTVFAISSLIGLLSNAGFSLALLRDIGGDTGMARAYVWPTLCVKVTLCLVGTAVFFLYMSSLNTDLESGLLMAAILFAGLVCGSFGDLIFVALRALGRFSVEARVVIAQGIAQLFFVVLVIWSGGGLLQISIAIAFSKGMGTLAVYIFFYRETSDQTDILHIGSFSYFRRTYKLAIDATIVNALTQMDGLFVASFIGLQPAGLYQAATRLAYGAIPLGGVLNGISIPNIVQATLSGSPDRVRRLVWQTVIEYAGLGFALGVVIYLFGPLYTKYVLDESYAGIDALWPILSLFVCLRFLASGLGAVLVVLHEGNGRTIVLCITLMSMVFLLGTMTPDTPISMACNYMSIGALMQCILYFTIVLKEYGAIK